MVGEGMVGVSCHVLGWFSRSLLSHILLFLSLRNAKLFDGKSGKQAMTWWIGRGNQKMYYWGNASPGSKKCACAFSQGEESCKPNKAGESGFCNCDSGEETWLIDEGEGQLCVR